MRSNWRGIQEWKAENLSLSTSSNQACKLYDAALTQYVGWYNDPSFGGLVKTLEAIKAEDPNFVIGRVFPLGLALIAGSKSAKIHKEIADEVVILKSLANSQKSVLTQRELDHVKAIEYIDQDDILKALGIWEKILAEHPTDAMAMRLRHDACLHYGFVEQLRDTITGVAPYWTKSNPFYSYLFGLQAFGFEETNFYDKAESLAKKGLELNPNDGWATHALAHVYEMQGRCDEGISLMSSTVKNWETCDMISGHNAWHWSLFHLEKDEKDAAIDILKNRLKKRLDPDSFLSVYDAASLLYRLEMTGASVEDHWPDVLEVCKDHLDNHKSVFSDLHFLMACLGAKNSELVTYFKKSLEDFFSSGNGYQRSTCKTLGHPMFKAMIAYDEGRYADAVNLLYPIRYNVVNIGGSNAQRDVFTLLLIVAAIKSPLKHHQCLARKMLTEREAMKNTAMLTYLKAQISSNF